MPRDFANLSKRQQKRIINRATFLCLNDAVSDIVGKPQIASEEQISRASENTTNTESMLINKECLEEPDHMVLRMRGYMRQLLLIQLILIVKLVQILFQISFVNVF